MPRPCPALLLGVLALQVAGCTSGRGRPEVAPPRPEGTQAVPSAGRAPTGRTALAAVVVRVRIADGGGGHIATLPLDEYVAGTLRGELAPATLRDPASGGVLDVQAIIARTYALSSLGRHRAEGFDLCDATHCQVYRSRRAGDVQGSDAAAVAAARTRGQILTYDRRPIQALFHADCGGHTAAADLVWPGPPLPYLRGVPDWFCARASRPPWAFEITEAALRDVLAAETRAPLGGRIVSVDVSGRDSAGRATLVTLAGERPVTLRAEELRLSVLRAFGPRSLYSTRFDVVRIEGGFRFTGNGNGHGVGLCQTGAALRVRAGYSTAAVLAHYFPGTTLETR